MSPFAMSIVTAALTSVLFTAIFHFRRFLPEYSTSLLILTQSRLGGFSSCLCCFLFEIRRVLLTRCVWQGSYSGIRRNVFRYRYFLLHLKCFHTAILMSNFWQRASVAILWSRQDHLEMVRYGVLETRVRSYALLQLSWLPQRRSKFVLPHIHLSSI